MSAPDLTGDEEVEIETVLNGKPLKRRVKARQHLADFLRHELELTGTLDPSSTADPKDPSAAAPALRVQSGKIVAATCSE